MDSKRLGMTIEEMEYEIECMRAWDKYLKRVLGKEHYDMLCNEFALLKCCEWLEDKRVDSNPFREAMDKTRRAD